jgi:hypothetical protein
MPSLGSEALPCHRPIPPYPPKTTSPRSAPRRPRPAVLLGRPLPFRAKGEPLHEGQEGYEGIVVGVVMLVVALALIIGLKLLIA